MLKTLKQIASAQGTTRTSCCSPNRAEPYRYTNGAPRPPNGVSLGAAWSITYTSLVYAPPISSTSWAASYTSELACTQSALSCPNPELMSTRLSSAAQSAHTWLLMYHSHTTRPDVSISSTPSTYIPSSSSHTNRPSARALVHSRRYAVSANIVPRPARTSKSCMSKAWWMRWVASLITLRQSTSPCQSYTEIKLASPGIEMLAFAAYPPGVLSSSMRTMSPALDRYTAWPVPNGVRHECDTSPVLAFTRYTSVVVRGEYSISPAAGCVRRSSPTLAAHVSSRASSAGIDATRHGEGARVGDSGLREVGGLTEGGGDTT